MISYKILKPSEKLRLKLLLLWVVLYYAILIPIGHFVTNKILFCVLFIVFQLIAGWFLFKIAMANREEI